MQSKQIASFFSNNSHRGLDVLSLNHVLELLVLVLEVVFEDDDVRLEVGLRDLVDLAQVRVNVVAPVATVAAKRTAVGLGPGMNPEIEG